MTKFTNELKIKIIKDYISGMSLSQLAKKYNITISYLNYIIALYRVYGYDYLISCKKFTPQIFYHYRVATSILQNTYTFRKKKCIIFMFFVERRILSPEILSIWVNATI